MTGISIRCEEPGDATAVAVLVAAAFGGDDEAMLVSRLRADGDVVLALVAVDGAEIVGHLLFSRLRVGEGAGAFPAVALAPLAVAPARAGRGIGGRLVEDGHARLRAAGETFSVVLGDPAFYRRFGYDHDRAAGFASEYQGPALQALDLAGGGGPATPRTGRLVYATAFEAL